MTATMPLVRFDAMRRALAAARTVDEVKDVRDKAEALRLYMRQAGESLEMQNDVAEIKIRAERRAGELLIEMSENGERQERGGNRKSKLHDATLIPPTLADLGIERTQAFRWKTIAKLPAEKLEQHIAKTKAQDEELTTAGLLRLAKTPHVANNTGETEWYTPKEYIAAARVVLGKIDLDPASCAVANRTVRATRYYDVKTNGLAQEWRGVVWLNPPYANGLVSQFIEKLVVSVERGNVTSALVLVNNATDTQWFARLVRVSSAVCFPTGRVKFLDASGNPGAPLQGQAIAYVGENVELFHREFEQFGWVCRV